MRLITFKLPAGQSTPEARRAVTAAILYELWGPWLEVFGIGWCGWS